MDDPTEMLADDDEVAMAMEGDLSCNKTPPRSLPSEVVASGGGAEGAVNQGVTNEEVPVYYSPHQHQVSLGEYYRQSDHYTTEALRQLKASPEFKSHTQKCLSCGSSWGASEVGGDECEECGGYGMTRPCPLCQGQCGTSWSRDVDMSRRFHKAHWNGECGMSDEQRRALFLRQLVETNPGELTEAMEDLSTL